MDGSILRVLVASFLEHALFFVSGSFIPGHRSSETPMGFPGQGMILARL